MNTSIWTASLNSVCADLAGAQPTPAAGSAAAISARLAACLLLKVLEIAHNRTASPGQLETIFALQTAARVESEILARAADEDGAAFLEYLDRRRKKADRKLLDEAMLQAIEVPMTAARSCVRALALSQDALALLPAFIEADLAATALLLSGAVRAILIMVDDNLRQLSDAQPHLAAERNRLEAQADAATRQILDQIRRPSLPSAGGL
jgi:formiminotetrahydrofolate cyclodeaminase